MATQKIIYKGNVIDERDASGNPAILYNGKVIGDIIVDSPRTLETENTVAVDDIIIGSAVLNCKGKALKGDIEVTLEQAADPVLGNNTWEMISKTAKRGQAANVWSVGDTKTVTCNVHSFTAQIIGFDHDDVTDSTSYGRSKAGITFQFVECYPANYKYGNNTDVWSNAYARTDRMQYFLTGSGTYAGLVEAQNYVVPVNKQSITAYNDTTIINTVDSMFLLSEAEYFGKITYGAVLEGTQYAYYAAGNSKVKTLSGSANDHWTRSQAGTPYYYEVYISTSGTSNRLDKSKAKGYAPAFCI